MESINEFKKLFRPKETGVTIKVELNKMDIIHLLSGSSPSYDHFSMIEKMGLGHYVGGFADRFEWENAWNDIWNKYSEEELFDLYLKISRE